MGRTRCRTGQLATASTGCGRPASRCSTGCLPATKPGVRHRGRAQRSDGGHRSGLGPCTAARRRARSRRRPSCRRRSTSHCPNPSGAASPHMPRAGCRESRRGSDARTFGSGLRPSFHQVQRSRVGEFSTFCSRHIRCTTEATELSWALGTATEDGRPDGRHSVAFSRS